MSFDSNAWYSIQNFGNDFYLQCSNVGNCGTGTRGLSNNELYQIRSANNGQSYYLRPKSLNTDAGGTTYCVNINTGTPAIAACSNASAIWGIGNWNGQDTSDGRYFFSAQQSNSLRLSLGNNGTFTLLNFNGQSTGTLDLMRWGVSSRSAINDQSYSTVPAAIGGSSGGSTTTTSSSTSATTSSNPPTSSSSTNSNSPPTSTPTTPSSPSTLTMVITPTVTASVPTATSTRTTSSIVPTVVNGADGVKVGIKAVLALLLILPQIFLFGV